MQSELLDILIIGSLVLLFAATYRKRTTQLVRSWTFGWLLILLHFTAQLFHPTLAFAQDIQGILSIGGLVACAIVFLYPTGEAAREKRLQRPLLIGAGVSAMAFVALVVCDVSNPVPYYFAVILGEICWIAYSLQHRRDSYLIQGLATVAIAGLTAWLVWAVVHGRYDIGIAALLTQLYWTVALTYTAQFRRLSAGTLTVSFGLLAWSAVFPAGEFCAHLGIVSGISPELWNIPKYFVAFGMILILLEDEIIAANEASKHYRLLFEANPHPMWIYDRDTLAFHSVNDAAVAQYGFPRAKFLGMTLMDIQASLAPGSMDERAQTAEALREADPTRQLTGPWQHKKNDGSMFLADIATSQMQTAGRELAFSLIQDVTERELLHERLLHQANHDMLTCLPNRARFEEYARLSLPRSDHQGHHSALLCIDIDRFKHINDTYGHAAGDVCLQEVGRRLAPLVHGRDLVARTGGEEFCLLLHDLSSSTDSEHVAARVLVALQAPINADGYSIELTGSIGIAVTPADGKDASTLWRNADCAMYRAKRAGGNQYSCMSPELRVLTSQATDIEQHVRRTLNEGQLEIHYQPLYKMDGELRGLEALVRLRHPEHGLISPDRFIPIVEESGLIVRLGSAVIEQVCAQLAQWKREGLPPVRVAVNISPLQITRPDFATQVIDLLTKHNIEPVYLGMEITETAVMRNLSEASRQIELLAAKGIAFSIDDFGTGYSSLGQLDKLPVRSLKIDRSFIERIHLPGGTWSIVDAIISMAHSLGLEVVAEGVESEAQLQHLRDLDCDTVQGFLFSRPLPAADIMSVLSGTLRKRPVKVRQIDQARTA